MAGRNGRRIWMPAAAYTLLLVTAAALVVGAPGPVVVSAMAGGSSAPPAAGQAIATQLPESFWHFMLSSGLPLLAVDTGPEITPRPVLEAIIRALPFAALRLALPGLALAARAGSDTPESDTVLPPPGQPKSQAAIPPATTDPLCGTSGQRDCGAALGLATAEGNLQADREETVCGGSEPLVLVYHTHSEESFLPVLKPGTAPGEAYTAIRSRSIVGVGDELVRTLCASGLGVVHLRTHFDADGRLGAYVRSQAGVEAALRRWPTLHLLLDMHRDDAPRSATTAVIGGQPTARVLIVVGNDRKLPEPGWQRNAAWALQVWRALNAVHPGLAREFEGRPYYSDGGRFNQQLSPAALLFEMGGEQNTLEEELRAANLLADVLRGMIAAGEYPP